jgi:hypothetical protein
MHTVSLRPAIRGLSVVNLNPELLMSMVRPEPVFTSARRRSDTVYLTFNSTANLVLARRSVLTVFGIRRYPRYHAPRLQVRVRMPTYISGL